MTINLVFMKGHVVQERKLEKQSKKKKKNVEGVYEDSISTYRIFSRAFCNFVFPRTNSTSNAS